MSTPSDPNQQPQPGTQWGPQPGAQPGPQPPHPPSGYGYGYGYGYTPPPPIHPEASTAMTLGLISVIGAFVCYLPIFLSPFAMMKGRRVLREIDAEPGRWSGRDTANTGYIMGIIGTVLLAVLIVTIIVVVVIVVILETNTGS